MQVEPKVTYQQNRGFSLLRPPLDWVLVTLFVSFSAACLLGGPAGLLRLCFPAGALLVSLFLYFKSPALYVGFVWWLWFLSPFVRRLVDFQAGWQDPNTILLAPFLATSVTAITIVRYLPKIHLLNAVPFILPITAVVYAMFIGLVQRSPAAVFVSFLDWFVPIAFGFHLFIYWQYYLAYCKTFQRTFLWGIAVMGAYGVWQFLTAPEWDRFWLINAELPGFGQPTPQGIRVWSTMHSPGPFAVVIMAGLLLLLRSRNQGALLASGVGCLALLLSQVRAVWLGGVIGLLLLISSLRPSLQIRLLTMLLVLVLCVVPLATIEPYSDIIASRLESLSSFTSDGSYQARAGGYQDLFGVAVLQLTGNGLGYVIEQGNFGSNDSGVLTMLFTLGWFGTVLYLSGLILLLLRTLQTAGQDDSLFYVFRSVSFAVIVQIPLGAVVLGVYGVVFWSFLGMAMAGRKHTQNYSRESVVLPAVQAAIRGVHSQDNYP